MFSLVLVTRQNAALISAILHAIPREGKVESGDSTPFLMGEQSILTNVKLMLAMLPIFSCPKYVCLDTRASEMKI